MIRVRTSARAARGFRPASLAVMVILTSLSACKDGGARRLPVYVPPLPDGSVVLPSETCLDRSRWIYVVDEAYRLLRFVPSDLTFTRIGTAPLACRTAQGAIPFSMAVDNGANAWVLYSDGSLHLVSTLDGHCTRTAYAPGQHGITTFGMAFASTTPMGASERLYVAGSDFTMGMGSLGVIDPNTLTLSLLGPLGGSPELTGNALAELWGFFPTGATPTIQRLDTTNASAVETFDLSTLGPDTLAAGAPRAWAFAFWGGDYWVFYRSVSEPTTQVYRFRQASGSTPASLVRVLVTSNLTVVGAGVSTCVPYIID